MNTGQSEQGNEARKYSGTALRIIITILVVASVPANAIGRERPRKDAILQVAFGTTKVEAQRAFDRIESKMREAFPGVEMRWAYTSSMIRKKLRKQGKMLNGPKVALAKLLEDGYTHIVLASFHAMPGREFHDLVKDAQAFRNMSGLEGVQIAVSLPLLSTRESMEEAARGILKHVPEKRKPVDAVIMMGHGSEHHPADAVYAAANYWLENIDPNVFVGNVEGRPKLSDIIPRLKKRGIKKAFLIPFMAVAGDHARNDMCGEEQDSWKSQLQKQSIDVECVLKGTGEMPEVVDIWVNNVKSAYSGLK